MSLTEADVQKMAAMEAAAKAASANPGAVTAVPPVAPTPAPGAPAVSPDAAAAAAAGAMPAPPQAAGPDWQQQAMLFQALLQQSMQAGQQQAAPAPPDYDAELRELTAQFKQNQIDADSYDALKTDIIREQARSEAALAARQAVQEQMMQSKKTEWLQRNQDFVVLLHTGKISQTIQESGGLLDEAGAYYKIKRDDTHAEYSAKLAQLEQGSLQAIEAARAQGRAEREAALSGRDGMPPVISSPSTTTQMPSDQPDRPLSKADMLAEAGRLFVEAGAK